MPNTIAKDLETVRRRIRASLLPDKLSKTAAERATRHADSIRPDGGWQDIDYRNRTRSGWPVARHLRRLFDMAVAYRTQGQALSGEAALRKKTLAGIDYWLAKDFRNPNWWWNQIGVPMFLGRVLIVMEEDLSSEQLAAGIRIMKRSRVGMTGANLVWLASNQVRWGCLAQDAGAVRSALRAIAREIRVADGGAEGIKPDRSFWQHGRCLYSGGYGMAFAADASRFAAVARGTAFEFPAKKVGILASYVLDGQQWMVRGRRFDYGVIGRQISRPHGNGAAGLGRVCRRMREVAEDRAEEFDAFARRLEARPGDPEHALRGNRHFWNSDFMAHHRPEYYTSARMVSSRIANTDMPCNGEGLLSHHIADGANFLMRTGEEYDAIFPVWDWQKVPGITVEYTGGRPHGSVRSKGGGSFVGGVSDGTYGAAGMELTRGTLRARKAWFFFDRQYVCLGTGIVCTSDRPVLTSVNQCLLDGEVRIGGEPVERAHHERTGPATVHHDRVGYVFPEQGARLVVRNVGQTGSWRRISRVRPADKITRQVFSLWLDHGRKPDGAGYAYLVVPGVSATGLRKHAAAPALDILSNTAELQAVRHKTLNLVQAVFHKPGPVALSRTTTLSVDRPCLVLARRVHRELRLAVARPDKGGELTVTVNLPLDGDGCTWSKKDGVSRIPFNLPAGNQLGRSILRTLTVPKD
jgi:chondroitin AC lyase